MRKDILTSENNNKLKSSERHGLIAGIIFACLALAIMLSNHSWEERFEAPKEVKPLEVELPDFSRYADVAEKKRAFFDYLRPIIKQQNMKIAYTQAFLEDIESKISDDIAHSNATMKKLNRIAKSYRVSESEPLKILEELKLKVDFIPESLILVQAANESAWGSSRFAREANNLFGQWCFEKGCGLVPNGRGVGKNHEVRRFNTPSESVASYMKNLNSHPAYRELRMLRSELKREGTEVKGSQLATKLESYSERKGEYVKELVDMIRQNNLE